ncbi:MAG TPA: CehA/McbA family metallohydrolase [Gemmataceae bacterium]|nr:CehA/McbA family metallohydrolase [Gemmataceae bacterium]
MHTVHVRVNDAATGKPTPCRVRFTDAEGRYYAPLGRMKTFPLDPVEGGSVWDEDGAYAYIDGACEIQLPAGEIRVWASKGFEYRPIDEKVQLAAGKLALRFTLERWVDPRREGWHSGDARAAYLTPHAALLEAAGEDLSVVDLLACEERRLRTLPNLLAFSGQQPALERLGHLVVVNTMNQHDRLGRLALLNCHRVIYPLSFGGPTGVDDWTLADWCDQCHRKGGLVVGLDFFDDPQKAGRGEVLADLITGKIDALEMEDIHDDPVDPVLRPWYALLSAGFRIPLVGASCKSASTTVLGCKRTYARLPPGQELTYKNWTETVRAGRTFVTRGPILAFTVNGQDPGAVLDFPAAPARVAVRAEARGLWPFRRLEVVCNGAVVACAEASGSPCQAAVEQEILLPGPCWLTARCWGMEPRDPYDRGDAQTSAVYAQIAGRVPRPTAETIAPFLADLDKSLDWVAHEARCDDKHRQRLAGIFQAARQELLRRQKSD